VTVGRAPRPRAPGDAPPPAPRLARVLLPRPRPIADPPRLPDDPWPTPDGRAGPVLRLAGPYRLSGGWWAQPDMTPVERDYYWAETRRGDLLWLFYDRARRRWFLQGHAD
jgi:protein ImuB